MGFDGEIGAVGIEGAEDYEVGVEILCDAEHGGARELGVGREAVAFEFAGAAGVGVDLLACVGKILDREFFEAFAEPVEPGSGAVIFKREDEVEALLGGA